MERKTILYITHAYNNRGGVEEHLKALVEASGEQADCHILYPEDGSIHHLHEGKVVQTFVGGVSEVLAPLHNPDSDAALRTVIEEVSPDIIHLMHFLYWPLSVFEPILSSTAKKVISFHDYYPLTPDFTGMSTKDFSQATQSQYALQIFQRDISPYLEYRRKFLVSALKHFDSLLVPSKLLERAMKPIFPYEYEEVPYGAHEFDVLSMRNRKNIRFGYLGSLIPQKGWESLVEGFRLAQEKHAKIELHLFGAGAPKKEEVEDQKGVHFHGPYGPEDLGSVFSQFEVGVIPSLFPETYSIVLSEMWRAKKPVCVSRIGALHERVVDEMSGKKFTPGDPQSICEALCWFMESEAWKEFDIPVPPTVPEMADRMLSIYGE